MGGASEVTRGELSILGFWFTCCGTQSKDLGTLAENEPEFKLDTMGGPGAMVCAPGSKRGVSAGPMQGPYSGSIVHCEPGYEIVRDIGFWSVGAGSSVSRTNADHKF
eukprot:CAMPEP_0114555142 /NCGR_PEP_ID=MMETSP0114-20121206/8593_1 /TAXON_ID=31324 /ORGANISM="Goniomonas sp, Strain m" /LENGTH=106 /DNA_ID=CAMNT_0001740251 /DNA_START=439 /DNA_END=760 /DNA_ORIENTATION=+